MQPPLLSPWVLFKPPYVRAEGLLLWLFTVRALRRLHHRSGLSSVCQRNRFGGCGPFPLLWGHAQALFPPQGQSTPLWDRPPSSPLAKSSFHQLLWPKRVEKFLKSRSAEASPRAQALMVNVKRCLAHGAHPGVWMTRAEGALRRVTCPGQPPFSNPLSVPTSVDTLPGAVSPDVILGL